MIGQRAHICRGGLRFVYQHQRLALMHRCAADLKTFQTALVDQPARRQLHRAVGLRIMRHVRILCLQRRCLRRAHNRIFEKAAHIAEQSRVGQLFRADGTHGGRHIFGRGCSARAALSQHRRQIAIARIGAEMRFQRKSHRANHIAPFA